MSYSINLYSQNRSGMIETAKVAPPKCKKQPKQLVKHDDVRIDDYYWLNQRENPEVINYLNDENAYTDYNLASTVNFQDKLYNEIVDKIKKDDESVPYFDNGYWYYTKFEIGFEYPIYCRKAKSMDNKEEIILDVNKLAEGKEFCNVTGLNMSPNNELLAYAEDITGRNLFMVHIKNLKTGELYKDSFQSSWGGSVWANDNKTLFYDKKNEVTLRSEKVYKHKLGTDSSLDEVVFDETDETFSIGVGKTKSDKYIVISSYSTLSSEVSYIDADAPDQKPVLFYKREKDHLYGIDHFEDHFLITTNWNAKNFRLMSTPIKSTDKNTWKEEIPHRDNVLLEGVEIFSKYVVIVERKEGLMQLRIKSSDGQLDRYVNFGEPTYDAGLSANPSFESEWLRYSYSSMTTPLSTYEINMTTQEIRLLKEQPILGGFNKNNYASERIYATAKDGTKVPISLVYRKGFKKMEKILFYFTDMVLTAQAWMLVLILLVFVC